MPQYIVFGSVKRPRGFNGGTQLDWSEPPIGVYQAADSNEAFIAAAKDSGRFGAFAVVECVVHGAEVMESGGQQIGRTATAEERMEQVLKQMADNQKLIAEVAAGKSPQLVAAEEVSAQMEKEAGL